MGIYRIETVRDQVLHLLRGQKKAVGRDWMALALHLPTYAVDAGLEAAQAGGLVTYAAGEGWWIATSRPEFLEPKEGLAPDERSRVASISVAEHSHI
ncbi:hypothetical protein [Rhodoferax sp. WC2427]|uniref:hypothetical protein n=1 Tax=Rhodoferax sp. WC2427 TaxID=3234144 RepID=UPI0034673FE8